MDHIIYEMHLQRNVIIKWLIAALLLLIAPNIVFWLLSPRMYLIRGVFVLEYFILACLYPFIPRKLFIVLWILFAIYDMTFSTTSIFFMDLFEMGHALAEIPKVTVVDILMWTGLVLLFLGITWLLLRLLMRYNQKVPFLQWRFALPLMAICLLYDYLNWQTFLNTRALQLLHVRANIVSVPSRSFINSVKYAFFKEKIDENQPSYLGSIAKTIFNNNNTEQKQMLVLVESWGLLQNHDLHREVLQPVYDLVNYTVREGSTRYRYLTLAGELREITGYTVHYYQADSSFSNQHSLFIQKQKQGYHVVGVHGFSGAFYNRNEMWPSLGVQETYFADKLRAMPLPICGNQFFRGICDTSISTFLFDYVKKQPARKEFIYWITLNTHLPIEEIEDEEYNRFSEKWEKQGVPAKAIQLAYHHKLFFADMAKKIRGQNSQKLHILIVGDHAPPFVEPPLRKMYDDNLVPYIDIVPVSN